MEIEYSTGVAHQNKFILDMECSDPFDIVRAPKKVAPTVTEEKENIKVKKAPAAKKPKSTTQAKPPTKAPEAKAKLADAEERNNRKNRNGNEGRKPDGDRPPRRQDNRPPRRGDDEQGNEEGGRRYDGPRRFDGERRNYDSGRSFNNEGGETRRYEGGERRQYDGPRNFDGERRPYDGERGRGRGRGFGRGGRGGGRGRDFDRQSGSDRTGVRSTEKREGGGAYNWGSVKESIDDETAVTGTDEKGADTADEGIGGSGDESANEAKEPEEPKELTLAEYKALQKRKKPEFKVRQAGEGENAEKWKSTFVLENKKVPVEKKVVEKKSGESSDDEKEAVAAAPAGKTRQVLDIDFQFADSPVRGGRGRGRGRGMGRGMNRGGRGARGTFTPRVREQQAPKMDDAMAFPSLK